MIKRKGWLVGSYLVVLMISWLATVPGTAAEVLVEEQRSESALSCAGRVDGFYCDEGFLVTCGGEIRTNTVTCASGCLPGPAIGDDRCAGDICTGIPDGSYCVPEEWAIFTCALERTSDRTDCPLGCANALPSGHDQCRGCGVGRLLCNGSCVNGANDTANCGACANACHEGAHGAATCSLGHCGFSCQAGYRDCDGNLANGCEAALLDDSRNCGSCGQACGAGQSCQNGTCANVTRPCDARVNGTVVVAKAAKDSASCIAALDGGPAGCVYAAFFDNTSMNRLEFDFDGVKVWGPQVGLSKASCAAVCQPRTCKAMGANCGVLGDGCGAMLVCGFCRSPETCGGGGRANTCGIGCPNPGEPPYQMLGSPRAAPETVSCPQVE
jgi:hypothetical protein